MLKKYKHVALGGTFDLLHKGHIALINKAFSIGQKVTIGITTNKFGKINNKNFLEPQLRRQKNLAQFLSKNKLSKRARLVWLDNIFGPAATDKTMKAVVVSTETLKGAQEINRKRQKSKLKKLAVIIVPQVLAKDKKPISSTRIKNGEISTNGDVYKDLLYKISGKKFTNRQRAKLKKPFGKIINISSSFPQKRESRTGSRIKYGMTMEKSLIAIGDISVSELIKIGILPHLSVVDFYVKRKLSFQNLSQLGFGSANPDVIVKNEAGQISKALIDEIEKALQRQNSSVILVDGEEDLAAIPAVLLAKIGSTIIYGQPDKGAVKVDVTTETKDSLCRLLNLS